MCLRSWKPVLILAFSLLVLRCGQAQAQAPTISSISPASGVVGSAVTITGTNFGPNQGSSTVSLNGSYPVITSWNSEVITAIVPSGASSGSLSVTVNSQTANSASFTVLALPSGWSDQDVGSVGPAGSATYSNGEFIVKGSGQWIYYGADEMNFAYQSLSGDGTIVARLVSLTGSGSEAGVTIRETLNDGSTHATPVYAQGDVYFLDRTSTGGGTSYQYASASLPRWMKVVRSGSSFSAYQSTDGVNWAQIGSSVTISMAQNVYVGLVSLSGNQSSLATATFDNVSIASASTTPPVISGLSATTASVGSQVLVSGSGFGPSEDGSVVMLNDAPVGIDFWSDTSIIVTIPSGATSGNLVVSLGPGMNDSNPVAFEVTSQPLPTSWLDQDVGTVATPGRATYSSGKFTVVGSGQGIAGTADGMHFVYQPLSGDGTIVARIVSATGSYGVQAGVMIRETLEANATNAYLFYDGYLVLYTRSTTGGSTANQAQASGTPPYWIKLVRSGSSFSAYTSQEGLYWTQLGSTQTISMSQNAYVGLAVSAEGGSSTASFDNVSISSTASPAPAITSISATTGPIGAQVLISGSGFGASEGNSLVLLNGAPVTVNSWSGTSVIITIPSGASSGYLVVSVGPSMNDSNPVAFTVTSNPLPTPWLDQDVGVAGVVGSATYSSGVFSVVGSGQGITGTADGMHFVYQPLSGDGTITARGPSFTGSSSGGQTGVMIRETLDPGAVNAFVFISSYLTFYTRSSAGSTTSNEGQASYSSLPYWVKLVRSGNTFSAYTSSDGSTWTQLGSTETITMAQNVYVGLALSGDDPTTYATSTFDNVVVTIGATPFISGLSPHLGGTGASVTITGSNFGASQGSGSTVSFNGTTASSITSWSAAYIVAVVPSGTTTGPVVVTVSSVQSIGNPTFTLINPVISNLEPPNGEAGGEVIVNGSGFGANQASSQVQFNGVAAGVVSWSDTSITVYAPNNATSGPVTVIEDGVTSNGVQFTVTGPLSVTAISPTSGPVGTSVTVTGTGFGATQSNSTVAFGGTNAAVTSWSDTHIVAVVPSGASTGPVGATVASVTAYGPTFQVNATVTLTDSLGNQSSYTSEIAGGKWYVSTSQGSGCSSCDIRGNITTQFDSLGNTLSTTDELGNTTSNTYDSNNNLTQTTQPTVSAGTPTTTYTYNSFGEVLTMTDPLGHVTTNAYDSHGNLTSVTTPVPGSGISASVTQFAYNSLGELTQITDPLSHVTTMTYTSAGLIATITDPQSHVTTYAYDSRGNRTSITDALSHVTSFAYDSGNRLTTIIYPDSSTSTFTYDYRGRRITATDQNGKTTTYAYDDADRLTSVTDPASNVTSYTYDTENNLLSIVDANSHTTSFSYDAFGRVTQTTFPSGHVETYSYDADNNLTSKTDRKSQTIQYVYDALNRLTEKTYPDSTNVEYTYDLVGKVLQVNDPTGTYGFSYDNMGRLIGTSTQYSFLTGTFTNAYTYDAASNRTGYTAPDSSTNTYSYDTLNRLTTLANSWAGSFGFSYDALSRRTQMTRPNSVTTNYTYDSLSRLLSVLHQVSGSTIDGASYTLDSAGNRTAKTDQYASVTSNYTYDPIYELTQVTQASTTTESYSYDAVGNRTASLGVSSYTNNSSNELTATSNASYTYDYNGNTASKTDSTGTTSYTWDYENRLAGVTLPSSGGTVSFKYDPFGRRIEKISPTTTSIFAYDGDNLIQTVNSSGGLVAHYTPTQNIDELLAMQRGTTTSYYEQDGLDSVTSLSSSTATLAQTYTYDSFGNTIGSSGSLTNFFRLAGREFDTETGLYFLRARYLDPSIGRFISEDPIGFKGGIDFYSYVKNRPLLLRDPDGTCPPGEPCPSPPLFDSVTAYVVTCPCVYKGDTDKICHCIGYPFGADSDPKWMNQCTKCFGAQQSPAAACQCACALIGDNKATCDALCKGLPNKSPK